MWNKNFTMVVIGQIISLLGNAILRFSLPLYLLNQTNSAALFGIVSACSFIPMILLSPIGGILADRVNKRNIMVILDFSTAALTLIFTLLLGKLNLVGLLIVTLIILYGIQGAYQPSVQASIPVLLDIKYIMQGNAVINLVSSMASLVGPILGGMLFAMFGIHPILFVCMICFLASAMMEIFIHIPYQKREIQGNIFQIGYGDLKESFQYMLHEQSIILKLSAIVAVINCVLSALIMIALPIIIMQKLGFEQELANKLYGFAEGIMGAGSLIGGASAGIFAKKLKAERGYITILISALTLLPTGIVLTISGNSMLSYIIIMVSCFIMMAMATLFSVQILSYLQIIVPEHMVGKIISCVMCISGCAMPLGQAIYGVLLEMFVGKVYVIIFAALVILCVFAILTRKTYVRLAEVILEKGVVKSEN